jgi:hypothetical protein
MVGKITHRHLYFLYERERRTIKSSRQMRYVMCLVSKKDKRMGPKRKKKMREKEKKYSAMMLSIDNVRPINY